MLYSSPHGNGYMKYISPDQAAKAINAVIDLMGDALIKHKEYCETHNINRTEGKVQAAYLHGVLHGLHNALSQFERRSSVDLAESNAQTKTHT